jgi:glycosyltransferase involved in cell wall biosynthesis
VRKVLFILDTLEIGGAEKSLLEISSCFTKYVPVFIQLFPGERLKPLFDEHRIEVIQLNLKPSFRFSEIASEVLPYVNKIRPVAIHSTLFKSDLTARALKRRVNIPLINSFVNNSYVSTRYSTMPLVGKIKLYGIQLLDRLTSKNVDLFISNSAAIKFTNAKALGIKDPERIKVIYRGRDKQRFIRRSDESYYQPLIQDLAISGKRVFLNVSRLLSRKGQLDLLDAFKVIKEKYEDVILLIAGEGPVRRQLEERISQLNLPNDVKLLGSRTDVDDLLQVADYFIFPSHYEGLPGALIEAMMAGLPIAASAIPENLECIDHASATLFEVSNIDSIAAAMEHMLKNPDLIKVKAELAFQVAIKKFDIRSIARQYESVYDQLLKNR